MKIEPVIKVKPIVFRLNKKEMRQAEKIIKKREEEKLDEFEREKDKYLL